MCTAIFAFGIHPTLLFLLAFNREEFFSRRSAGVHQWPDNTQIIAPRDLKRKGTWLGMSTNGRISFLTNIRVANPKPSPQSRGLLPVDFLTGTEKPTEFLSNVDWRNYSLLNLFTVQLFDEPEVAMLSSLEHEGPFIFDKGIHGATNGRLSDPTFYKVQRAKADLKKILLDMDPDGPLPYDFIFEDVMGNSIEEQADVPLPSTGLPESEERKYTPVRINPFWCSKPPGGLYGTVSQTVLAVWSDNTVEIHERIWNTNQTWYQHHHFFTLDRPTYPALV